MKTLNQDVANIAIMKKKLPFKKYKYMTVMSF